MSCNFTRFYYCEEDIDVKTFLSRDIRLKRGIAFEDIETAEADAFEEKLKAEGEEYLRIDL